MSSKVSSLGRLPAQPVPPFTYGADPELFLEADGQIIGSEKVIPKEGLAYSGEVAGKDVNPFVVRDGVQVEVHPAPAHCRVQVGGSLGQTFASLAMKIEQENVRRAALKVPLPPVKACWRSVITVSPAEMDSLTDDSKKFGCQESLNIYGDNPNLAEVNAESYPFRAAGGHIHIGLGAVWADPEAYAKVQEKTQQLNQRLWEYNLPRDKYDKVYAEYKAYIASDEYKHAARTRPPFEKYPADDFIRLMDIFVGNTGVLLDRDELAAERRRYYGRAGEYRTPAHGYEYRVLSNWWARSYQMASFVWGMTRLAGAVLFNNNTFKRDFYDKLMEDIDIDRVRRAINENNLILAKANWKTVRKFINKHVTDLTNPASSHILPLGPNVLDDFEHFLEKGIEHWFPVEQDWLANWSRAQGPGWEMFLTTTVAQDRAKKKEV